MCLGWKPSLETQEKQIRPNLLLLNHPQNGWQLHIIRTYRSSRLFSEFLGKGRHMGLAPRSQGFTAQRWWVWGALTFAGPRPGLTRPSMVILVLTRAQPLGLSPLFLTSAQLLQAKRPGQPPPPAASCCPSQGLLQQAELPQGLPAGLLRGAAASELDGDALGSEPHSPGQRA